METMSDPNEQHAWLDNAAQQAKERISSLYREGLESLDRESQDNSAEAASSVTEQSPATSDVDQLGGSL
uniref:hypothetical protein n=1 Tax=Lentzea alba TaxID=2714351 RepID=UPI0039BF2BE0